ncbi:VWA domain-containing protein [Ketobacter sp. MCCC 1A13808]|uniref:vWA domain-containing protein n=1 Tax=Ketobacter sp. MCCC 1A13808 TaxID=2602738 RepID=UPI000F16316A|nr:VWA domain-containing protein [Ketobacter sp. MCCC 1A13808]MVF10648.1 VWA domain-containing protein [Ketobacter sp. MCCC 1A13808]RLP56069.1 MAG: VWA domain-containing protein [Ketobacter sp.]
MLIDFFFELHEGKVPVSIREYLDLLSALEQGVIYADMDQFYYLSRTVLVKDEKHFDKFDQAFKKYFEGLEVLDELFENLIPDDWLRKEIEKNLSKEEYEKLKELGDLDKLMEEFKKRLEEQKKRHQGGNKMIGTGGTSPFGAYGQNPAGFRMAGPGRTGKAIKVWEKRQYRNLDDSVDLGVRNIKMALRRLRKFTRSGMPDQLDIDDTIDSTARNAGFLDIKMVPERRNGVKVLLFFDVGGSMDPYVRSCEELFSAARTEFKHMEYFYFHNFIYEGVWKDNARRWTDRTSTWDILHKYSSDYRVIFVGDATMSPYEISSVGGSVEHWNEEAGEKWLTRLTDYFEKVIWLNPEPENTWEYTTSVTWTKRLMEDRMYPLTLKGLEESMRYLAK